LKEPLFHLIQNALEHGLESPQERRTRGKTPESHLKLKACHKDGAFLLEVEDDGCGLDPNKIKQRAVELGWLGNEEEPPSRLLEFIFKPGFSAKAPGSVEAGTGLDTVRRNMESLLGSVRVQSRAGRGCKFTLKMPRSLALMDGWVVQAGDKKYLLPVAQTLKIEPVDKVASPKDGEMVPVISLARALGGASSGPAGKLAVLVEAGFQQVRLRVDEVPGKQQVLVKNNKEGFTAPPGLRAEALLTDGTTGWILDIASLLREKENENP
jgi:two-component system chemotaxis sensor kinase CheA